jgi:ATP-dependent helicase/nuclease subunit A
MSRVGQTPADATESSRSLDQASRGTIREELLTNLLVEAGAGSGKTQMLAERMAAGVASGAYQIEHLAAVTFTRKAASELRGRFHLALEASLRGLQRTPDPGCRMPPIERVPAIERVSVALSNLERFFAGTIHSFCARLLRERPVEAGVSPGFTELDEMQNLELRKRAWRDFVTSTRASGDPDMMALLAADVKPADLDSAFATICLNEDVEFPPGEAMMPDPTAAWKALEQFWNEVQKHLPSQIDPDTRCLIQNAAREFRGQLNVQRYRLDRPSVIAALLKTWQCESKIVQYRWADSLAEKKRLRDVIQPLHEQFSINTVKPYLAQWRQYVYRLSVTLLTRARDHAAAERRRVNSLNYGDLLNLTAKVFRENAEVRRSLQKKYRHLFVDEFQDTDPVQAEIVFLLAADDSALSVAQPFSAAEGVADSQTDAATTPKRTASREPRAADWRSIQLRPGSLFVVGDPKQSIYRFRRADIDIYNIVRARFSEPAIGHVLPLTMNFRSVAPLCDWANDVFKTRFPADPTTHSPRFAALDVNPKNTASGGVFTLSHTCERYEALEYDARQIAAYIRTEVDAGRRSFSDFMILTRKKRGRIVAYAHALEALNIPIEVSGAGAFGDSKQVKGLTVLLRALSDPQDALALIAVFRGPLFGISDRELFAYKQSGGWFSIFAGDVRTPVAQASPLQPDAALATDPAASRQSRTAVQAALAALHQYYRWTRLLPAAAALDRILEHSGYLALAATTPGGVEAGDVLHAVDRVRQVVEEGGSLGDAADSLEEDVDTINEVESLPLEPGRSDVVRIMNLHKAKGLEAKVVFLADPNGGFAPRVDVHIERTELNAEGWFQVVRKTDGSHAPIVLGEHVDWDAHKQAELPYLQAEEDRLLYVAATRAREMLVVSRWIGSHKLAAWGALNGFLTSSQELPVPASVTAHCVAALDCSLEAQAAADAARDAAQDIVREPSWSITSVTAEAHHIARMTRAADATADDPTKVVGTDTPAHRADAGMAWGTLIHGLLEHAMRHKSATREDLRRLAMWLTVDEPQLRTVMDQALDTIEVVAHAEFWLSARATEHSEETPFVVADGGQILINGVIDLLFKDPTGWQIRDYKTDVTLNAVAYEQQLQTYLRALRVLGCESAAAELVDTRAQK